MKKIALITGVTGQDGSYLAELLLSKNYLVIGTKRRSSLLNTSRIDHLLDNENFKLEYYDLSDNGTMYRLIQKYNPDEIYNIAAQSHVKVSFELVEHSVDSDALGPMRILEAIRNLKPDIKFYQASSSEMYGDALTPENGYIETSLMTPASPYACSKLFAHNLTRNYRHSYNIHASSGILFNHESPRRGETFVTRKITIAAAKIKLGFQQKIELGNLDAKRDWGHARDYVEAMWLMLQQQIPDDYVIATGVSKSVRDFLELVFNYAGLDPYKYLVINPRLFRPHEVPYLLGNANKAKNILNWNPKTDINKLAKEMYESDLESVKRSLS